MNCASSIDSSLEHLEAMVGLLLLSSRCRVQLFATPWITAHQTSLSFAISQSLLKLRSIESVMLCGVTNWPPINIVSQRTGKPEERERVGKTAGQWSSQNTHNIHRVSSLSYITMGHAAPKQLH